MATANTGAYDPNDPQYAGTDPSQYNDFPGAAGLSGLTGAGASIGAQGVGLSTPTPPTGSNGVTGDMINQWYQQDLGRSADTATDPTGSAAWNAWSNLSPEQAQQGIYNSAEAQAYRAAQTPQTPAATTNGAPGSGTNAFPLSAGLTAALAAGPTPISPANQQLRDFMTSQLGTLSQPITADSASTNPAISAFNAQSQRDQAANQAQIAEQAYAQGLDPTQQGATNTASQAAAENYGLQRAQNTGNTIYQANQARQQQLQQMLQTATSAGLTDQAQQIQQQLAELDAQLSAQGLQQSSAQANNQLGLSYNQLMAQQNRDAIIAAMSPYGS